MRAIGFFETTEDDGTTLEQRGTAFRDYCSLNMHQPVTTFHNGGGEDTAYERVVEYIRSSRSEFLVVVPDTSHLGSDLEAVTRKLVDLNELGAVVGCSDDEFPEPLQNALHTLGVKGVSTNRSDSIKKAMRARALEGKALGRPVYGYRIGQDGRLDMVPDEATVVRLIYRLYTEERRGIRLIAQYLNNAGIPTRRGGSWSLTGVRDLLRNPAYIGTYTRFGMRRPRAHPAIVETDVYRAAQKTTRKRRPVNRVARPDPFLLSGMAHCGYCENKMMGVTRRRSWRRKDGQRSRAVYRYYQCQSRNNQGRCGYHTWHELDLDTLVIEELKKVMESRPVETTAQPGNRTSISDPRNSQEVTNAERNFLTAVRRSARGEVSVAILGGYLKNLDTAREAAANIRDPSSTASVLDTWETLALEPRRAFLNEHVETIIVRDDDVTVTT